MIGDIETAQRTLHNYFSIWKKFGFLPEFYNVFQNEIFPQRQIYPLRPGLFIYNTNF